LIEICKCFKEENEKLETQLHLAEKIKEAESTAGFYDSNNVFKEKAISTGQKNSLKGSALKNSGILEKKLKEGRPLPGEDVIGGMGLEEGATRFKLKRDFGGN